MKNKYGFLMIELVLVIVVIEALATIIIPRFMTTRKEV